MVYIAACPIEELTCFSWMPRSTKDHRRAGSLALVTAADRTGLGECKLFSCMPPAWIDCSARSILRARSPTRHKRAGPTLANSYRFAETEQIADRRNWCFNQARKFLTDRRDGSSLCGETICVAKSRVTIPLKHRAGMTRVTPNWRGILLKVPLPLRSRVSTATQPSGRRAGERWRPSLRCWWDAPHIPIDTLASLIAYQSYVAYFLGKLRPVACGG